MKYKDNDRLYYFHFFQDGNRKYMDIFENNHQLSGLVLEIIDNKIAWTQNIMEYLLLTEPAKNYIEKIVKNLVFI